MLSNGKVHPETGKTDEIGGIKATSRDLIYTNGGKAALETPSERDEYAMQIDVPVKSYMPVTYKDVSYSVRNSANRKERISLLNNVSGYILPGCLTALMGPSGSGKTTLLDILAGRKTVGKITGTVLFAGHKPGVQFLRRYSAYVEQFDTLIPNFTVYEMLMYTIELKQEKKVPLAEKKLKVEAVLRQLNLDVCRNVLIGSQEKRGISGGQSKRVNVGLALVTNPRVLFMDEPTTGLDSFTANEVLTGIKALVHHGIAICSTIHSPTPYCFSLFDHLTLLLRGNAIYCGPNGDQAVKYFETSFPEVHAYGGQGSFQNPAEWIVDLTTRADRDDRQLEFSTAYDISSLKSQTLEMVEQYSTGHAESISEESLKELAVKRATTNGFFFSLWILIKYRVWRDLKDPQYLAPRIAEKAIFSFIIFSLYWKVGARFEANQVNNQISVLFMWVVLPAYSAAAYIPSIVQERGLYVRERSDGLHRPITYLCMKILGEFIVTFFLSLACSLVVFYCVRLAGSFIYFWLVFLIIQLCGIALGYAVAALSPNMEVANIALPLYVTVLLFFAGLLIRPADQPRYWHWFSYINFVHYGWAGMMVNQYRDTDHRDAIAYNQPVLTFYDMATTNKWAVFGWLWVFFAVYMFITWLALAFKRLQKR